MAMLRIRDDVVYREVDGVIVAFSIDTGEYVALDAVGTDIWRRIEQDGRVQAIRRGMLADYDLDESTCIEELARFVDMLRTRRLVTVADGD